jgi:hypothetical protein
MTVATVQQLITDARVPGLSTAVVGDRLATASLRSAYAAHTTALPWISRLFSPRLSRGWAIPYFRSVSGSASGPK